MVGWGLISVGLLWRVLPEILTAAGFAKAQLEETGKGFCCAGGEAGTDTGRLAQSISSKVVTEHPLRRKGGIARYARSLGLARALSCASVRDGRVPYA